MNDELNRYLAADIPEDSPGLYLDYALAEKDMVNLLVYGTTRPTEEMTARAQWYDYAAKEMAKPIRQEFGPAPTDPEVSGWLHQTPIYAAPEPVFHRPAPPAWFDGQVMSTAPTEAALRAATERAVRHQRRMEFLRYTLHLDEEEAEALIDLMLPVIRVGGRGAGKTYRAEQMRRMNERLEMMHIPADFKESAKHFGLTDPEGLRLVELIYRRRNPMTDPVELRNEEGEKSLALRFDGGSRGNAAMCRFLRGTHHTHHRAKEGQREHIVITQDDKKLPVEAGDWVLTNEGWGFSVFTADEYDKKNERSD